MAALLREAIVMFRDREQSAVMAASRFLHHSGDSGLLDAKTEMQFMQVANPLLNSSHTVEMNSMQQERKSENSSSSSSSTSLDSSICVISLFHLFSCICVICILVRAALTS